MIWEIIHLPTFQFWHSWYQWVQKISNKILYLQFWGYGSFMYYFRYIQVSVNSNLDVTEIVHKSAVSPKLWIQFFVWYFFCTHWHHKNQNWEDGGCIISKIIFQTLRRGASQGTYHVLYIQLPYHIGLAKMVFCGQNWENLVFFAILCQLRGSRGTTDRDVSQITLRVIVDVYRDILYLIKP